MLVIDEAGLEYILASRPCAEGRAWLLARVGRPRDEVWAECEDPSWLLWFWGRWVWDGGRLGGPEHLALVACCAEIVRLAEKSWHEKHRDRVERAVAEVESFEFADGASTARQALAGIFEPDISSPSRYCATTAVDALRRVAYGGMSDGDAAAGVAWRVVKAVAARASDKKYDTLAADKGTRSAASIQAYFEYRSTWGAASAKVCAIVRSHMPRCPE